VSNARGWGCAVGGLVGVVGGLSPAGVWLLFDLVEGSDGGKNVLEGPGEAVPYVKLI